MERSLRITIENIPPMRLSHGVCGGMKISSTPRQNLHKLGHIGNGEIPRFPIEGHRQRSGQSRPRFDKVIGPFECKFSTCETETAR